jgi:serine/threonine protein kinase
MALLLNNRYKILQTLGSGGCGQTFLAEDTHLPSRRCCAIKQFKPVTQDPLAHQIIKERFQREAAILEVLGQSCDQIPKLYAYFSENNEFYLVQEWVEGKNLMQVISEGGVFGEKKVRHLLASILPVLEYIHSQKIIHRDIKPENIMLRSSDGNPVLIDFGAVKEVVTTMVDSHGTPTSSIVVGSPGYMPLEQVAGKPLFASDIYSLGLTSVFLLTGRRPQELVDLQSGEFSWHEYTSSISSELKQIIDKAIQTLARDRYQSARQMLDSLLVDDNTPIQQVGARPIIVPLRNKANPIIDPSPQLPTPKKTRSDSKSIETLPSPAKLANSKENRRSFLGAFFSLWWSNIKLRFTILLIIGLVSGTLKYLNWKNSKSYQVMYTDPNGNAYGTYTVGQSSVNSDNAKREQELQEAERRRLAAEAAEAAAEAARKAEEERLELERLRREEEERKQRLFKQAIEPRHYTRTISESSTSDIEVVEGDYVEITASGTIRLGAFVGESGPDGIDFPWFRSISNAQLGALLARVYGCGNWKIIGSAGSFPASCSGELQFFINDSKTEDNRGGYSVIITVRPNEARVRNEIWK